MAHYKGPKARINRRLGVNVYDSAGAIRAARKRPTAPGEHPWRKRAPSPYGLALINKQIVKHYYGLHERQLRRFFDIARRSHGNIGSNLLSLCERRLDNMLWRAGLVRTRAQARQALAHGHVTVNGRTCKTPSQLARVGDVLEIRDRKNLRELYAKLAEERVRERDDCAVLDPETLRITVERLPGRDEVTVDVDIDKVIELLSR